MTIRADISASDGTRFIREALVSLAEGGRPYRVREWRRGDIRSQQPCMHRCPATTIKRCRGSQLHSDGGKRSLS